MAANEVKVTVTADDLATEVIRRLNAAVKQLSAQQGGSNNAFRESKRAAEGASSAFSTFQKAITGVAAALGAIRVLEFVRDTIEATDQIGKLAQKTGASTEALSILAVAASTADLSQQDLGDGLKFLSRSLTELNSNIPKSVDAFAAIGLSAKDLKGLSLDQVLVKIANAQAKFGDGAGKAAVLMQIFGRNGTALIPLLHDLANGGFDEVAKKARDLGLVISGDAAKSAQDFDDSLTTLKNSLKGVVIAFAPMIKNVADLADRIAAFVSHNQELVAAAGALSLVAGGLTALAGAVALFSAPAVIATIAFFTTGIGAIITSIVVLGSAIAKVIGLYREWKQAQEDVKNPAAALAKDPALEAAIKAGLPDVKPVDSGQRKGLIEAQLAAAKQELKDELAATESGLKLIEEIETERFAQGLASLREFYAQRVSITKQGVAAQISELEGEKAALEAAPLAQNTEAERIKRTSDIRALEAQIARAKIDGQAQVLALLEQERQARLRIADEVRGFQAQILSAQGQQFAAAQIQITASVNKFILALQEQGGHTREEIQAQAEQLRRLLTIQAQFAQAQNRANQETTSLDLARAEVQNKVAQGLLSERDGQLQIAAIERQRLPTLENLADQMDKFAADANNPELRTAAEQFRASFQGIGKVIDESTKKLANLKGTIFASVQSDLSEFLGNTISHVNSLAEAFGALAQSIAESFQRVIGDIIASKAIEAIRNLFEHPVPAPPQQATDVISSAANEKAATAMSAASVGMVTAGKEMTAAAATMLIAAHEMAVAAGASTLKFLGDLGIGIGGGLFASGGPVRGPGTGTSDSILARLSAGEYVLRADAVRKLGIPFLDALNGLRTSSLRRFSHGLPGFATGGMVTGGGSGSITGGVDVTVSASPGSFIDSIKTSGGVRALYEVIGGNPKKFRAALGIE